MNLQMEIKDCDFDLMSSAFDFMIIQIELVKVNQIIESFIILGLDFCVVIKSKAMIKIMLRDIATSAEFDQIKNVLHKEGILYAFFN